MQRDQFAMRFGAIFLVALSLLLILTAIIADEPTVRGVQVIPYCYFEEGDFYWPCRDILSDLEV